MASTPAKMLLLAVLVTCFAVQSGLVYTDRRSEPLSEQALAGRDLYHRNACQVCHQLYGQGGFLGPDLTNAASRVDAARLKSLLTVGSGQMTALHFTDEEVDQMAAFLTAMDRPDLGRGQLRLGTPGQSDAGVFARVVEDLVSANAPAARGFAALSNRSCAACHQPFRVSPVGAPDLSLASEKMTPDELRTVLTDGRPASGMPPPTPGFSSDEIDDVAAYLSWLGVERDGLQKQTASARVPGDVDWASIPFWTYR